MARFLNYLPLLILIVIFCPALTSASYIYYDLHDLKKFLIYRKLWASSGFYLTTSEAERMQDDRQMDDFFVIETSRVAFPFNGTCGLPTRVEDGEEMMPQCDVVRNPDGNNWPGTTQGCCNTRMQVELPQVVTSVITGLRHQALQFSLSSQLVHTGRCENEGGMCILGGRCTTVYRIQWLLVRGTPLNAAGDDDDDDDSGERLNNDVFVPTSVPNHCQCVFS